jgi:phosphorylase kinase alpha/beta subunit
MPTGSEMKPAPQRKLAVAESASPEEVEALYRFLKARGTFDITPLRNGLFPAAGRDCPSAAASGYSNIWVRDNIHIAYAFWQLGRTARAKKCVIALAAFFRKHEHRFKAVIAGKADPDDPMQRPHIRFHPRGLAEIAQPWSHAQNDAMGYFLWFYCKLTRAGIIAKKEADIGLPALIATYLEAISFWQDPDSGHWEEERKVCASSIGVALAGLCEFEKLIGDLNLQRRFEQGTRTRLSTDRLGTLITRGRRRLNRILPYECIDPDPALNRPYDAALLFLIEPVELLSGPAADRILAYVRTYLQGRHGIRRYLMDSYWGPDYRSRAAGVVSDLSRRSTLAKLGDEAQWCIFDPVISTIYAKRYLASGRQSDYQNQRLYFNRALSQITSPRSKRPYRCPEAYFREKGRYTPNDQLPLSWTQANLLVAFRYLKETVRAAADRERA